MERQSIELPVLAEDAFEPGQLGEVIEASVEAGIWIKLIHTPENLRVGTPVIIEGEKNNFYALVVEIKYPSSPLATAFANSPMTELLSFHDVPGVRGRQFFALAHLDCLQVLGWEDDSQRDFDTIPRILSKSRRARQEDLERVYKEQEFSAEIGTLSEMEDLRVSIDVNELVQLPFGIFGVTGWGKSVLTKILATWTIRKQLASLLVFDIQGEYTWRSQEGTTPGLATIFGDRQVVTMALDPDRAPQGAEEFFLYKENVRAGDLITGLMDQKLSTPQLNSIYIIDQEVKKRRKLRKEDVNLLDFIVVMDDSTKPEGVNSLTVPALKNRVYRFARIKFLRKKSSAASLGLTGKPKPDSIERILELFRQGKTVVLNFGRYGDNLSLYMFVANLVVRRLRRAYQEAAYDKNWNGGAGFHQTVVLLEEAHKFLGPEASRYSIFGKIAREMRKYGLTLGLVDQRPSQIDPEVYSQLANRFVFKLTDEKDVKAALTGTINPNMWARLVRGLDKRTCVVVGSCISVPSVVRTWNYDEKTIKEKLGTSRLVGDVVGAITEDDVKDL
ncbi:MAG: DUF87 domain-containing protein [Promethearchaeota archaeon]